MHAASPSQKSKGPAPSSRERGQRIFLPTLLTIGEGPDGGFARRSLYCQGKARWTLDGVVGSILEPTSTILLPVKLSGKGSRLFKLTENESHCEIQNAVRCIAA